MAHRWRRAYLICITICQGLLNASDVVYSEHEGVARVCDIFQWLFTVRCGVLQGCPFSGTLFVIASDPFLTFLEKHIQNLDLGRVYVCADDIGAALEDLKSLLLCYKPVGSLRRPLAPG